MSILIRMLAVVCILIASQPAIAQTIVKGKIIDAVTKEPVHGASIHCMDAGCTCGCASNTIGEFEMHCKDCKKLTVSFIGYTTQEIPATVTDQIIPLAPVTSLLNEMVISANREGIKRSLAPIAI